MLESCLPLPAFTECADAAGRSKTRGRAIFKSSLHPAAAVQHAVPVPAPSCDADVHRCADSRRERCSFIAAMVCAMLAVAAVTADAAAATPPVVYSNYTLKVAQSTWLSRPSQTWPCFAGTNGSRSEAKSSSECLPCSAGTYNPGGAPAISCRLFDAGTFNPSVGSNSLSSCIACDTGTYNPFLGASLKTACLPCAAGSPLETRPD